MKNIDLNTANVQITNEMIGHFVMYLHRHQRAVVRYARMLLKRGLITLGVMNEIAKSHDYSKLKEPEFTPYVRRKWFERSGNSELYRVMGDDVKDAIVHHVTTNMHHPEYWSDDYEGFNSNKPCHVWDMPNNYVAEMVCDWMAMGDEHGNTARDWYNKTKDTRWIFDGTTTKRILFWLKVFEDLENDAR